MAALPKTPDEQTTAALAAFGASMRRERFRRGWTQEQAALGLGVDPSYYAKIERGRVNVTVGMFVAICNLLGFAVPRVLKPR